MRQAATEEMYSPEEIHARNEEALDRMEEGQRGGGSDDEDVEPSEIIEHDLFEKEARQIYNEKV